MTRVLSITLLVILVGCAATKVTTPIQSPPVEPDPPQVSAMKPPPPAEHIDWLKASDPLPDVTVKESTAAIRQANERAVVRPSAREFTRGLVVYPYIPGAIFLVKVAYQMPTHLVWGPDERFLNAKADDWFEVERKTLGDPPQDHLLVTSKLSKAAFPDIAKRPFRMVVLTTKAFYYISLETQDESQFGMTGVTWKHVDQVKRPQGGLTAGVYHVGYVFKGVDGAAPTWTPTGMWDTGSQGQTVIEFSAARQTGAAPLLFIIGPDGEKRLTNYLPTADNRYLIDRVFEQAELRIGHDDHAQVVEILRGPQYRKIRCPGAAECPTGVRP